LLIKHLGVAATAESNHRHADFLRRRPGSARPSRRTGRGRKVADRTVPPDRAHRTPRAPADRTAARGPCGSTGWAHRDRAGNELRHPVGAAHVGLRNLEIWLAETRVGRVNSISRSRPAVGSRSATWIAFSDLRPAWRRTCLLARRADFFATASQCVTGRVLRS
jgi:hypothetical protein